MKRQGVAFENNVTVGADISFRFLKERFDAICLACGSREPRDLPVPGRELKGIHFAMDFLTRQNKRITGEPVAAADEITAAGKTVVVIGGGDTGSDCLGTSVRQGAVKVHQLEILPKPPKDRDPSTPWPEWPLKLRKTHAHEEGGEQRWSVMTKAFEGKDGTVTRLRCCEVDWEKDEKGRMVPSERKGTEFEVKADLVLLAMGFTGPEPNPMLDELHVGSENRGPIQVNEANQTSVKGLFAAGDMSLGQSLVVRAIADGRRAALGIRQFLEKQNDAGC
jgi:glutamate synthase (NADPH/NADH) small chain